jgi:phosphoribosyl 1,2-cyclic phosphodiesterase
VLTVTPLASSSAANATVIDDGATRVLLDAGVRWSELRRALGFAAAELGGVLITHEHQDHCRAAAELARRGLDVYATAGTLEALRLTHHRARVIAAGERFEVGSFAVLPFSAVHDAAEPVGFFLASNRGARVLYATDTAYIGHTFDGLTHVLVECNYSLELMRRRVFAGDLRLEQKSRVLRNHLGLERVVAMLEANDLTAVREIHLLHLSDGNADAERFRAVVRAATGKPVYIANR